jgi:hypothetical protein
LFYIIKVALGLFLHKCQKKSRVSNTSSISKLLKFASQFSESKKPTKYTFTKIPDKITSTVALSSITKNDLLNILRSKDFREIIRKILQEELRSYRSLDKVLELLEDHKEDDPMDINITRLENAKDLLALGGKVNGIEVQCLANTYANAFFIQKDLAVKLGLDIDENKKYDVAGAGPSRTFGMVKDVSIELTSDCIITENLAVLGEYKHREIGLSRACLKRYNYNIHESREHIVLTCGGKNVFIPITPDINRGA